MAATGIRHRVLEQMLQNRMQVLFSTLMFNSVAQSAAKTDAFEVFLNGDLVFSKLKEKRMPALNEIIDALTARGIGAAAAETVLQTNHRRVPHRHNEM